MNRIFATVLGIVALVFLAGCAGSGGSHQATGHKAASAVPVAAPKCSTQVNTWVNDSGGKGLIVALSQDTTAIANDARAVNVTALQQDGAILQQDAGQAMNAPLPKCADPGHYWPAATSLFDLAGNQIVNGQFTSASNTIAAGTKAISNLNNELKKVGA